jgi:hypothetical protein
MSKMATGVDNRSFGKFIAASSLDYAESDRSETGNIGGAAECAV